VPGAGGRAGEAGRAAAEKAAWLSAGVVKGGNDRWGPCTGHGINSPYSVIMVGGERRQTALSPSARCWHGRVAIFRHRGPSPPPAGTLPPLRYLLADAPPGYLCAHSTYHSLSPRRKPRAKVRRRHANIAAARAHAGRTTPAALLVHTILCYTARGCLPLLSTLALLFNTTLLLTLPYAPIYLPPSVSLLTTFAAQRTHLAILPRDCVCS